MILPGAGAGGVAQQSVAKLSIFGMSVPITLVCVIYKVKGFSTVNRSVFHTDSGNVTRFARLAHIFKPRLTGVYLITRLTGGGAI